MSRVFGRRSTLENAATLFGRQPIAHPHAKSPDAFDATNARRQFGTEEPRIGRLIGNPSNGRESEVDRCWRVMTLFKVNPVAQHHGLVER